MSNKKGASRYQQNRTIELKNPNAPRLCPELAVEIGLNESIMFLQLEFWISVGGILKHNRRWTYRSVREIQAAFPFWSAATINRTIQSLQDQDLIHVGNYNQKAYDKTRWFALNYSKCTRLKSVIVKALPEPTAQNETRSTQNETPISQFETAISQNETRSTQNETTIHETVLETVKENNILPPPLIDSSTALPESEPRPETVESPPPETDGNLAELELPALVEDRSDGQITDGDAFVNSLIVGFHRDHGKVLLDLAVYLDGIRRAVVELGRVSDYAEAEGRSPLENWRYSLMTTLKNLRRTGRFDLVTYSRKVLPMNHSPTRSAADYLVERLRRESNLVGLRTS